MFKLEKQKDKAVLTIYGFVGGYYLDFRAVNAALDEIKNAGYKNLDFWLHTYGGDVFEGNMICNFLDSFKGEIDFYIPGVAASMGAIIIRSGNRVHMADNAFQMIHAPKGGGFGTSKQLAQASKLLTSMEKNFVSKLVTATGKTEAEVKAWMDGTDYWFDADECIALGLATDKFTPKNPQKLTTLDKTEAAQIGAKAVFDRFTAFVADPIIYNSNTSQMNKEDLIKRYGLTGVTAQSTDEEVLAAVDAKVNAGANSQKTAEEQAKAAVKTACQALVDKATDEKKLTKEQGAKYVAIGESMGVEALKSILDDLKPYTPQAQNIHGKGGEGEGNPDRKGWDWERYQAEAIAELEAMPKQDPDKFKALYKAKYGVEPEI